MRLVDCNVVVALNVDSSLRAEALRLFDRDPDWHSEPMLLTEFVNVMATLVRTRRATAQQAGERLQALHHLMRGKLHPTADDDVLNTANHFGISGYDARYIVVARALGTRLVTEDRRLRQAVPDHTCSIVEALAA